MDETGADKSGCEGQCWGGRQPHQPASHFGPVLDLTFRWVQVSKIPAQSLAPPPQCPSEGCTEREQPTWARKPEAVTQPHIDLETEFLSHTTQFGIHLSWDVVECHLDADEEHWMQKTDSNSPKHTHVNVCVNPAFGRMSLRVSPPGRLDSGVGGPEPWMVRNREWSLWSWWQVVSAHGTGATYHTCPQQDIRDNLKDLSCSFSMYSFFTRGFLRFCFTPRGRAFSGAPARREERRV